MSLVRRSEQLQVTPIVPEGFDDYPFLDRDDLILYMEHMPVLVAAMDEEQLVNRANDKDYETELRQYEYGCLSPSGQDIPGAFERHAVNLLYANRDQINVWRQNKVNELCGSGVTFDNARQQADQMAQKEAIGRVITIFEPHVQKAISHEVLRRAQKFASTEYPTHRFETFKQYLEAYHADDARYPLTVAYGLFDSYMSAGKRTSPQTRERLFEAFVAVDQKGSDGRVFKAMAYSDIPERVTMLDAKVSRVYRAREAEIKASARGGRTPDYGRIADKYGPMFEALGCPYPEPGAQPETLLLKTRQVARNIGRQTVESAGALTDTVKENAVSAGRAAGVVAVATGIGLSTVGGAASSARAAELHPQVVATQLVSFETKSHEKTLDPTLISKTYQAMLAEAKKSGNDAEWRAVHIMQFLTSKGLNQACAATLAPVCEASFIGNFDVESAGTFSPTLKQFGGGPGRSFGQWSEGGRFDALLRFAKNNNLQPYALGTHESFVWQELTHGYKFVKDKLDGSKTVAEATAIVERYYEAPANFSSSYHERTRRGERYFNWFMTTYNHLASAHSSVNNSAPAPVPSAPHNTAPAPVAPSAPASPLTPEAPAVPPISPIAGSSPDTQAPEVPMPAFSNAAFWSVIDSTNAPSSSSAESQPAMNTALSADQLQSLLSAADTSQVAPENLLLPSTSDNSAANMAPATQDSVSAGSSESVQAGTPASGDAAPTSPVADTTVGDRILQQLAQFGGPTSPDTAPYSPSAASQTPDTAPNQQGDVILPNLPPSQTNANSTPNGADILNGALPPTDFVGGGPVGSSDAQPAMPGATSPDVAPATPANPSQPAGSSNGQSTAPSASAVPLPSFLFGASTAPEQSSNGSNQSSAPVALPGAVTSDGAPQANVDPAQNVAILPSSPSGADQSPDQNNSNNSILSPSTPTSPSAQAPVTPQPAPSAPKHEASPKSNQPNSKADFAQALGVSTSDLIPNSEGIYLSKSAEKSLGYYRKLHDAYRKAYPKDGAVDKWGMYTGQCVSWSAFRVSMDDKPGAAPVWGGRGNANQWIQNARRAGYKVDKTPAVGAVLEWDKGAPHHEEFGHSSYVEKVFDDGSVLISEYNNVAPNTFSMRIIPRDQINSYMYFIHFEAGRS